MAKEESFILGMDTTPTSKQIMPITTVSISPNASSLIASEVFGVSLEAADPTSGMERFLVLLSQPLHDVFNILYLLFWGTSVTHGNALELLEHFGRLIP